MTATPIIDHAVPKVAAVWDKQTALVNTAQFFGQAATYALLPIGEDGKFGTLGPGTIQPNQEDTSSGVFPLEFVALCPLDANRAVLTSKRGGISFTNQGRRILSYQVWMHGLIRSGDQLTIGPGYYVGNTRRDYDFGSPAPFQPSVFKPLVIGSTKATAGTGAVVFAQQSDFPQRGYGFDQMIAIDMATDGVLTVDTPIQVSAGVVGRQNDAFVAPFTSGNGLYTVPVGLVGGAWVPGVPAATLPPELASGAARPQWISDTAVGIATVDYSTMPGAVKLARVSGGQASMTGAIPLPPFPVQPAGYSDGYAIVGAEVCGPAQEDQVNVAVLLTNGGAGPGGGGFSSLGATWGSQWDFTATPTQSLGWTRLHSASSSEGVTG